MKSIEKLRRIAEEQSSPVMCKLVRVYTDQDGMSASNSQVMEALGVALDEIEQELEEHYVELPVDSDGIPIHPNDEIVVHYPGMEPVYSTVTALILTDRWDFEQSCYETDSRDVNNLSDFYENVRHVQPDSWEKIIEDATALGAEMGRRTTQVDDLVERCKRLAKGRKPNERRTVAAHD